MRKTMKIKTMSATFLAAVLTLATTSTPVFPQSKYSNAAGDGVFEFIGQAAIPAPNGSQALYGYLSYINGVSGEEAVFNPGPRNETTALFTFYRDTVVEQVI